MGDYLLASERCHLAIRALPSVAQEITVGKFDGIGLNLIRLAGHTNHRLETLLFPGVAA